MRKIEKEDSNREKARGKMKKFDRMKYRIEEKNVRMNVKDSRKARGNSLSKRKLFLSLSLSLSLSPTALSKQ